MKYTFKKTGLYYGLLGAVLLAALIDSCRPKNNDDINPDVDSTAISTCIPLSERINGALLHSFEYDSTRRLTRMIEYTGTEQLNKIVKRYTFEYNKDVLTRIRETNLATRDRNFIYELDYKDGNVTTIRPFRVYNSGPRAEDTLTVLYDEKNRVSELQSLRNGKSKWEYDTAGNVRKWLVRPIASLSDSLLAEYTEYDDKVNVYAFSKGIQLVNLINGRAASKRNPTKFSFLGTSNTVSYLYNEKRVPTEAVVKSRTTSDTTLRETVFLYQLDCK